MARNCCATNNFLILETIKFHHFVQRSKLIFQQTPSTYIKTTVHQVSRFNFPRLTNFLLPSYKKSKQTTFPKNFYYMRKSIKFSKAYMSLMSSKKVTKWTQKHVNPHTTSNCLIKIEITKLT